jgi:hypothetical protein
MTYTLQIHEPVLEVQDKEGSALMLDQLEKRIKKRGGRWIFDILAHKIGSHKADT